MNKDELQEVEWLHEVRRSVSTYAATRFEVYARKVLYRLQRLKASGIFGDDYNHKTGWDEYCYEVQEGPHELLEQPWDHLIGSLLTDVVSKIPHDEAVLLSIAVQYEDDDWPPGPVGVCNDRIAVSIRRAVDGIAIDRNMDRFEEDW